ncbi:MAG: hypothetical protein Q9167_002468, partial [Letrouitia subvulpina]
MTRPRDFSQPRKKYGSQSNHGQTISSIGRGAHGKMAVTFWKRPRPGRRWCHTSLWSSWIQSLLCTVLLLSTFCAPTHALSPRGLRARGQYGKFAGSVAPREEQLSPADMGFFRPGDIVYDRRALPDHALSPRQQDDSSETPGPSRIVVQTTAQMKIILRSTATASAVRTISAPSKVTNSPSLAKSSQSSVIITDPAGTDESLPTPLDSGLGNNYTEPNCPVFVRSMLNNDTFSSCMPLSILLQNSMSFFSATKTMAGITRTLNASCGVVEPMCSSVMSTYAAELIKDSNCGNDYNRQNPLIVSVYNGLIAYEPLYRAGCEQDGHGNYCFANAITNTSSPTDPYIYYMPLGIPLPGGSLPTCSACLKKTMGFFYQAAQNKNQIQLSANYVPAAQMITIDCGPGFVNDTLPGGK